MNRRTVRKVCRRTAEFLERCLNASAMAMEGSDMSPFVDPHDRQEWISGVCLSRQARADTAGFKIIVPFAKRCHSGFESGVHN